MVYDEHVKDYRAPRTVFLYELVSGGYVSLRATRNIGPDQLEWATRIMIDNMRRALKREWEQH